MFYKLAKEMSYILIITYQKYCTLNFRYLEKIPMKLRNALWYYNTDGFLYTLLDNYFFGFYSVLT